MEVIDRYLAVHEHALAVRTHRSTLLASNLVNIDTPGFHPSDIDFTTALNDLMQQTAKTSHVQSAGSSHNSTGMSASSAHKYGHFNHMPVTLAGTGTEARFAAVGGTDARLRAHTHYREALQVAPDGNSVNSEHERALFTENALRIETGIQLLTMRIGGLIKAIRGD